MKTDRKILVIALDGAPFDRIHSWAREGKLPTFKKLIDSGVSGRLKTTLPPDSLTAWSSFMSGKNPGKHGIYDFTYHRFGSFKEIPVNATVRHGRSIFRILSDAGKSVGVINVPVTYPPEEVNGFFIAGFPLPRGFDYTYPPDLKFELLERGWNLDDVAAQSYYEGNLENFLQGLYSRLENRAQAMLHFMRERKCHFFMVHFLETDKVQHDFLVYTIKKQKGERSRLVEKYGDAVLTLFQKVDRVLDRVLKELDKNTVLILASDHGFTLSRGVVVNLNNWLVREGYMKFKKTPIVRLKRLLYRIGFTPANLYRLLPSALKGRLRKRFDEKYFSLPSRKERLDPIGLLNLLLRKTYFLTFDDLDWSETKAYCFGGGNHIYINLKGKEAQGIVEPGNRYRNVRDEIIAKLREGIPAPSTGQDTIERVHKKEEVYWGPRSNEAPDITVTFKDFQYLGSGSPIFYSDEVVESQYTLFPHYKGFHTRYGLLVMLGEGIKRGEAVENAEITDLAPTILYLLGEPIPSDMDGKLLRQCFRERFLKKHPVRYAKVPVKPAKPVRKGLTPEEEEAMLERLRAMGYVD